MSILKRRLIALEQGQQQTQNRQRIERTIDDEGEPVTIYYADGVPVKTWRNVSPLDWDEPTSETAIP